MSESTAEPAGLGRTPDPAVPEGEPAAGIPAAWADAAPIDPASVPVGELGARCGIVVVECDTERVVATMPVAGNRQPYGLLHGGASAVLAESLGSIHANVLAGPGRVAVGVELNCTHHRSATRGTVTGVSTPLYVGRSIATFHIAIRDDEGRPTCTARLTCLTRSAQGPQQEVTERAQDTRR